jgi:hypothetical protein
MAISIDWRTMRWAVVFWLIGFTILAFIPPTNSGWFLLTGAVAVSIGAWFAARAVL